MLRYEIAQPKPILVFAYLIITSIASRNKFLLFSPVPQENANGSAKFDVVSIRDGQ